MSTIKKYFPYVIVMALGASFMYFFNLRKADQNKIKQEVASKVQEVLLDPPEIHISNNSEAEKVYCPEQKECPPIPKCNPKVTVKTKVETVYKDRVVYVPVKPKPGCKTNWDTGITVGATTKDMDLKCDVDHLNQKVRARFTESKWAIKQREAMNNLRPQYGRP